MSGRKPKLRVNRDFLFNFAIIGFAAACGGTFFYMAYREHVEQAENRDRCEMAGGRYLQHGEKYYTGLCVRPEGIIWERLP